MEEQLLTQEEAAAKVGKSRMCITHWQTKGYASVGKLVRYHINDVEADPERYGVTAEIVAEFRATHFHTHRFVVLLSELMRFAVRVRGQGYPVGRPRRGWPA